MKKLTDDVIHILGKQGFVIVSSLDKNGAIHCSAKGIVGVDKAGLVYLIDLYQAQTFNNLKRNPTVSITAIDDNQFIGYTLKGTAEIVNKKVISHLIIKEWEARVTKRISNRLIRNIKNNRVSLNHPEAKFPEPQYLIAVKVEAIVDLTPAALKPAKLKDKLR